MRIKIFILTWNDSGSLNNNIRTLFNNVGDNPLNVSVEVNVINNHPVINIEEEFVDKVKVYNNSLRSLHSNGHLARSWNQALINGFGNLNHPECDIVINIQDDMVWEENWLSAILDIHSRYNFYTCSWGDSFCSYTPDAVKKIGIWDERFCANGFQECDYFMRALLYNKEKSSINNIGVSVSLNPYGRFGGYELPPPGPEAWTPPIRHFVANRTHSGAREQNKSNLHHEYLKHLFNVKWGGVNPEFWTEELKSNPPTPKIPTYMTYPYFECDIENRPEKGYI